MKKLSAIFFLLIFFSLFFNIGIQAQTDALQGEHIQSFDSQITINADGTINVKETIVYDFDGLERHGIYRDIPFVKTNKAGKKFRLGFSAISVADEQGSSYQFKKSEENQNIRLKVGDPDKTITGVHTYVIGYKVSGALTYFSDHDELYWNVTGNDWPVPIGSPTSGVGLPAGISQDQISANCFTGQSGSTEQLCRQNTKENTVSFASQGSLTAGEGMTIVVGFPKNIVAVLEPKPYVTFWESIFGKVTIAFIILALILWYIVYPVWIPIKWLREGRDPKPVATGEVRAWFDPPKSQSGRPLTPAEAGALVDERVDMRELSGMIVSLAQKGFVKIVEKNKGKFSLVKTRDLAGETGLLPFERNFLSDLFQSGSEISLESHKTFLYTAVEKAKKEIYEQLVASGFFPKNPQKTRTFYTVIGSLALTTFNVFLAFSSFLFGRHMPKKTLLGVESAGVTKSLRNFLTSQERQLEFQAKNQLFFEKLLPYAIVFGVEKIWADRFKELEMKPPDWYQGYSGTHFNSLIFASSLNSSFASFNSAATPTTSSSGFSSGFSGGSSGGGGGGGGGGSW